LHDSDLGNNNPCTTIDLSRESAESLLDADFSRELHAVQEFVLHGSDQPFDHGDAAALRASLSASPSLVMPLLMSLC
jgi:hypothetical protein